MYLSPKEYFPEGTPLVRTNIVSDYEDEVYPISKMTPGGIVWFTMTQKDIIQKDLIPILGSEGIVSMVLNGRRALTVDKMVKLGKWVCRLNCLWRIVGRMGLVCMGLRRGWLWIRKLTNKGYGVKLTSAFLINLIHKYINKRMGRNYAPF